MLFSFNAWNRPNPPRIDVEMQADSIDQPLLRSSGRSQRLLIHGILRQKRPFLDGLSAFVMFSISLGPTEGVIR